MNEWRGAARENVTKSVAGAKCTECGYGVVGMRRSGEPVTRNCENVPVAAPMHHYRPRMCAKVNSYVWKNK